jgi:hypothetical protein
MVLDAGLEPSMTTGRGSESNTSLIKTGSKKALAPTLETLINRNRRIREDLEEKRRSTSQQEGSTVRLPSIKAHNRGSQLQSVVEPKTGIDGFVHSLRKASLASGKDYRVMFTKPRHSQEVSRVKYQSSALSAKYESYLQAEHRQKLLRQQRAQS